VNGYHRLGWRVCHLCFYSCSSYFRATNFRSSVRGGFSTSPIGLAYACFQRTRSLGPKSFFVFQRQRRSGPRSVPFPRDWRPSPSRFRRPAAYDLYGGGTASLTSESRGSYTPATPCHPLRSAKLNAYPLVTRFFSCRCDETGQPVCVADAPPSSFIRRSGECFSQPRRLF